MTMPLPPDHQDRQRAIHERERNVLVDAGAGTGKTRLVVERLVQLVAPADDARRAVPLSRIAAVTFTRKAAGELRLRIREHVLGALATEGLTDLRRTRLAEALAALDVAHVGTIHAFADRLLRRFPVEARLSPSYEVVDDGEALAAEGFHLLLQAAQAGTLADELVGRPRPGGAPGAVWTPALAAEVEDAVLRALRAGVRTHARAGTFTTRHGLDSLFRAFVENRDAPPPDRPAAPFDLERFREAARELVARARDAGGEGPGSRWAREAARRLERLLDEDEPALLYAEVNELCRAIPQDTTQRRAFRDDPGGWRLWKAWRDGEPERTRPLRDDLVGPLQRWMATRLARVFPAAVTVYEGVKTRRRVLDQLDLLLRLRGLLRDDLRVRAACQAMFDHVFVDEFQDTDPLQAEIVLYLCERAPVAAAWSAAELQPGKLTLVGDPKQSIYRFRRADIAMYDAVRELVRRGPCLTVSLVANFRSAPGLIRFVNARFDELLGAAVPGAPVFDRETGTVANEPLAPFRALGPERPVIVVPYEAEPALAEPRRRVEARALAAFLRGAVEDRALEVVDPETGSPRPARYSDVAVLATSTANLELLFAALDRLGVPHAARGGTLFLDDPLHRQFLLALRAVADPDDGVARAALLRPPFFAIEVDDLARHRAGAPGRVDEVERLVTELRRRRTARPPGETARALLDESGLARAVALGPNGAQRLRLLRELCLLVERTAAAEGLDFDGTTALLRDWALDPIPLDPPRPVGTDAIQVLTTHQAKGLEYPVVVLWDGCAGWDPPSGPPVWRVDPQRGAWALCLDGLRWEEPEAEGVLEREKRYRSAERRRLAYVAATRARDVLVIPVAGDGKGVNGSIARGAPPELVTALAPVLPEAEPEWVRVAPPPARPAVVADRLAAEVAARWSEAAREALRPRFAPGAVSGEAHALVPARAAGTGDDHDDGEPVPRKRRASRFGATFGDAVHRAIGLALAEPALAPGAAVARAVRETGLREHLDEAARDVARALDALAAAGLRRRPGPTLRLEYPVAHAASGRLLTGYVDLLGAIGDRLVVIDFKTDAPPGDVAVEATHPAYVEQVRSYARILEALALAPAGSVRCGLLFTAEDRVRWVGR